MLLSPERDPASGTPWMVKATIGERVAAKRLSVGELEAQYPNYCKAMRSLVLDGVTIAKARRTVCWQRLEPCTTVCRGSTANRSSSICT